MSPFPDAPKPITVLSLAHVNVVPFTFPVNCVTVVEEPLHQFWFVIPLAMGVGFTVMVKLVGVPVQALAVGVTVMVATIGEFPVLVAVNGCMSPKPLAAIPMAGLSFVQAYVEEPIFPEGLTNVVLWLLHNTWLAMAFTVGVGLISIVNDKGVPTQVLAVGVNTTVELMAVDPGLVAVKDGMSPVPLVPNPIAGLLLVQVYVVPVTVGAGVIMGLTVPGQ